MSQLAVPEQNDTARKLSTQRVLVVTDNRFWRNEIGSNARILTLTRYLQTRGCKVQVAFMGRVYWNELPLIANSDIEVRPALGLVPDPGLQESKSSEPHAWERLRNKVKRCLRVVRAAFTQHQRQSPAKPSMAWWREVLLRAGERRVNDGFDARLVALVNELMAAQQTTVLLVEYVHLAWIVEHVDTTHGPLRLRVIDTHDVQHERQLRFHAANEIHHLDISEDEESRWLSAFDVIVAIQPRDAERFRRMVPNRRVITLGHPQSVRKLTRRGSSQAVVGFVGSNMTPNRLAATELVESIWPMVRRLVHARVELLIVGGVCDSMRGQALDPSVQLRGVVENLDSAYAEMDVVVNPVRIGGGLKIKSVDALCRGLPLVTTRVGAEGLEDGIQTAFLIADDPAEFARFVATMLNDAVARREQGQRAYEYAATRFDPGNAFKPLDQLLAQLSSVHPTTEFAP